MEERKIKMNEEYRAALDEVRKVKDEVAAGNATVDDLKEAMAEAKFIKEKHRVMHEADDLISESAPEERGADPKEEDLKAEGDKELTFDDINELLQHIICWLKLNHGDEPDRGYIIAYAHEGAGVVTIHGEGKTLKALYASLSAQKPFVYMPPMNKELFNKISRHMDEIK